MTDRFRLATRIAGVAGLLAALMLAGAPAARADPLPDAPAATSQSPAPKDRAGAVSVRRATLLQLSGQKSLNLRGTDGSATVAFGSRGDELVVGARLHLKFSHSPALIVGQSHLKVFLNDELIDVAPFSASPGGGPSSRTFELDPRLVTDFNRLKLQFIGHYSADCEDQLHSALWAEVSGASEIELSVVALPLASDLALLPEPFFDPRDLKRLNLPFVFAAQPTQDTLRAAGTVASWFGSLAAWRGARFTTHFDRPPRGHAIVFATNDARPAFLSQLPGVTQATLSVIDNPADGVSKLLLVLGRDAAQLGQAAHGLVLGHAALSGPSAQLRDVVAQAPRQAYDAPRWVRTDRPMRFGELVADAKALQAFGHSPDRVRIPLRVPPDLFTWRSRGVPVNVQFRHNAPAMREGASRLTLSVNDELIRSFDLDPAEPAGSLQRVRVALLESGLRGAQGSALLPAFTLGARNQLELGFSFGVPREGACRDHFVANVRGEIDPDSSVDFSGFPHYAALPNLGFFANAGFPFTKFADLSQTVVVLPPAPTAADVSVFLTVLGRLGESTGYPALRLRLAGADDDAALLGADLLVIGAAPQQRLLARWQALLPAVIGADKLRLNLPTSQTSFTYDWLGFGARPDPTVGAHTEFAQGGPLGALLGLEHPLSPRRSVVVVTASASPQMLEVLDALDDAGKLRAMNGSVVLVHANKVSSLLVGPTYTVGSVPPWTSVWFSVSHHPLLLALLALLVAMLVAYLLRQALRGVAQRRHATPD
jgi:cellulose synthase operon protein B